MKHLTLTLALLLIVGCASKPEKEYVIETEYIGYDIPKELTVACKPPKMVITEEYSMMTDNEKKTYLYSYISKILGELKKCDNKVIGIKEFVERQNLLLEETKSK